MTLLIATTNLGKLKEIVAILGRLPITLNTLKDFPAVEIAEETGSTFAGNARQKALHYANATGMLTMAEDSGFEVDALNEQLAAFNFQIARATAAYRLEKQLDREEPRAQCVRTLAAFEPWPRWRADFLDLRRRCYERAAPDLAAVARAELDTYLAHAGGRFVVDGS